MKTIDIAVGSVYGGALAVATALEQDLETAGFSCRRHERSALNVVRDPDSILLVVTSTTGSGDLPEPIQPLLSGLIDTPPNIVGHHFAVIALGDSSYGDTYCGGGRQLREALLDIAATELVPMLSIDSMETDDPVSLGRNWLKSNMQAFRAGAASSVRPAQ